MNVWAKFGKCAYLGVVWPSLASNVLFEQVRERTDERRRTMVALFHSDSFETLRPLLAHPPSSILSFRPSLCYDVLFVFSQFFRNKDFVSITFTGTFQSSRGNHRKILLKFKHKVLSSITKHFSDSRISTMPADPSYLTTLDRDRRLPSCSLWLSAAFRAFRYLEHAKYSDLGALILGLLSVG